MEINNLKMFGEAVHMIVSIHRLFSHMALFLWRHNGQCNDLEIPFAHLCGILMPSAEHTIQVQV